MIWKVFPDGGFQLLTLFILLGILTVAAGAYSLNSHHLAALMSSEMDASGLHSSSYFTNMSSWLGSHMR